jgi:hypothetical protein
MPELVLRKGEFRQMMDRVLGRFEGRANFVFADNEFLHSSMRKMITDSKFVGRDVGETYDGSA